MHPLLSQPGSTQYVLSSRAVQSLVRNKKTCGEICSETWCFVLGYDHSGSRQQGPLSLKFIYLVILFVEKRKQLKIQAQLCI